MSYEYENEKHHLFTESGIKDVLTLYIAAQSMLKKGGAFTVGAALGAMGTGDIWHQLAAIDFLVEHKYLKYISTTGSKQNYVLVRGARGET